MIIEVIDALPSDLVGAELVVQVEAHLVRLAADHDAKPLRCSALGARVLDVVAPEVAEEHQRRELEAEGDWRPRRGPGRPPGSPWSTTATAGCQGRFTIACLHGAMRHKTLLAIAAPQHQAATRSADDPEQDRVGVGGRGCTAVGCD